MDKQRRNKILFICAAILIGSYVARYFILTAMRMAYSQHAAQQPKPQTAEKPVASASPDSMPIGNLSGVWEGRAPMKTRGTCDLRLELNQNDPEKYSGYSRFSCINLAPVNPQDTNITTMANRVNLDTAIMQGAVEKGSIRLHSDKTFGTDLNGCAVTDMTVTPFGNGGAMAEWQEGACPGGNLLMQRTR
jgi:hypothetical protein